MRSRCRRFAALPALLTLQACILSDASPGVGNDEAARLGRAGEPVQRTYRERSHFEYVKTRSVAASRAVGAIIQPHDGRDITIDGAPVRGTCGATFISPHYAVTAAHCVPAPVFPDPPNNPFTLETYDISRVSDSTLRAAETVTGTFPGYSRRQLTAADGYLVSRTTCFVHSRCNSRWGTYNCEGTGEDVALVRCPYRDSRQPWLRVAGSDNGSGPVEMYWFHEVLDMPTQYSSTGGAAALDRYDHYTVFDTAAREDNYHYLGGSKNQLLPLRSLSWPTGEHRRRVRVGMTDLFGCHGTSGSGILQSNGAHLELLGPATTVGPTGWHDSEGRNRLCLDADAQRPGQEAVGYAPLAASQALERAAWADAHENGPIQSVTWARTGQAVFTSHIAVCTDGALYAFASSGRRVFVSRHQGLAGSWAWVATLPADQHVVSAACGAGTPHYLTSDGRIYYLQVRSSPVAAVHVGTRVHAREIAAAEDGSLDHPLLWAQDSTTGRPLSVNAWGGLDGHWVEIDRPWAAQHVSATRSVLFAKNDDGSFWVGSPTTTRPTWRNVGTIPATVRDIASATDGPTPGPVHLYRLDADGGIYRGTPAYAAPPR